MTLGIIMKAVNSKYFHKTMDFIFEFIPQLVLLLVTFGYMNMLIVIKWWTYYEDTSRAPSIVATMIDMMLGYGAVNQTPLIYSKEAQRILSVLIIVSIVISVPMMLLAKPIIITQQIHKKNSSKESGLIELGVWNFKKRKLSDPPINDECKSDSDDENGSLIKKKTDLKRRFQSNDEEDRREAVYNPADDPYSIKDEEKKDEAREKLIKITKQYKESNHHNIEEIWIHQLIETVEFVLGTVSNTASYLRLWALSLAHSQLAAVFYDKLLRDEIEQRRWFMASLIIPFFLAAHFFILMWMDSMEWFLHTLRLHWVEFQNKFFKGTGYRFITVSNNLIIFAWYTFSLTERIGFKQGEETN